MTEHAGQTDEEVAVLAQNGDIQAFGTLVDRYEAKIKRYAKRFLFDREDTNDITQEVFMKAYVNIRSFDPTRRFSPWIYRIAHNEFVNALKKKLSSKIFPSDLDLLFPHPVAPETADEAAHKRELRAMLDGYLDTLDAKYREPLILYYYEDMDYREISDILHLPVSTVGIRLQRGKAILRKEAEELAIAYEQ